MARKYAGHVKVDKVYQGDKTVGLKLNPVQALDLAIQVLEATKGNRPVEITAYLKGQKDGTFNTTVTYMEK